jgi:nuclear cap-binding protein subunit 1
VPDSELEPVIARIETLAGTLALAPLVSSTDVFVTAICHLGSKSLSHVLSCIDRCSSRLMAIGAASEPARRQVITSVMDYWRDHPGVGISIVDKLLNFNVLTPSSVITWALVDEDSAAAAAAAAGVPGARLALSWVYEMVSATIAKVARRTRSDVLASRAPDAQPDDAAALAETVAAERAATKTLAALMDDALSAWAAGSKDQAIEQARDDDVDAAALVRGWGARWLRVFRRRFAVEDAWFLESERAHMLRRAREREAEAARLEVEGAVDV